MSRVFGPIADVLFMGIGNDIKPAILIDGRLSYLMGVSDPFFATELGNLVVCVGKDSDAIYSIPTWKKLVSRETQLNWSAAFERSSGWVFVGDFKGVRARHKDRFQKEVRLKQFEAHVFQVAVDSSRRALFTLEKKLLRCWTLGD